MLTPVGGSAPFLRYGAPTEAPNWYPSTGRLVPVPLVSNSYLQVSLKYFKNIPAIRGLQQISRPGRRTYLDVKRILKVSEEQN